MGKPVAAFEVEKFGGEVEREVHSYRDGKRESKIVPEGAGFMVYFPAGHSIRVKDKARLAELGLSAPPVGVNMSTADTHEGHEATVGEVRKIVEKATKFKETPAIVSSPIEVKTASKLNTKEKE